MSECEGKRCREPVYGHQFYTRWRSKKFVFLYVLWKIVPKIVLLRELGNQVPLLPKYPISQWGVDYILWESPFLAERRHPQSPSSRWTASCTFARGEDLAADCPIFWNFYYTNAITRSSVYAVILVGVVSKSSKGFPAIWRFCNDRMDRH